MCSAAAEMARVEESMDLAMGRCVARLAVGAAGKDHECVVPKAMTFRIVM